jgi:hypothetical protein
LSGRFWPNAQAHLAEWRPENLATLDNGDNINRVREKDESLKSFSVTASASFPIVSEVFFLQLRRRLRRR